MISAIVLTYNEEIHLGRCIENLKKITDDIFIVDSFSTDKTIDIANKYSVHISKNKWENNYAKQFNWALENLPIKTEWVLRLDADEYLTDELIDEIRTKINELNSNVTGIVFPLRRVFLNRHIKYGTGKVKLLRLFRYRKANCESRWMDEYIQLNEGESIEFKNEFADHNLNNVGWWSAKHNGYSIREAIDLIDIELNLFNDNSPNKLSEHSNQKRQMKLRYAKQPLFLRSFVYFIYRYLFKLGFMEGKEGFLWHFLQGWWYRTLVDAKIFEIKKACGTDKEKIKEYIFKNYQIKI